MFKMKKIVSVILTICVLMVFNGCSKTVASKVDNSNSETITSYPLSFVDSNKKTIIIEKKPERIVSLAPNVTETIFALGQGKSLVGRTDYCHYPAEASSVASVGSITKPNIEKIIEVKPDLIIATKLLNEDVITKLEALKIRVIVINGSESFNGVYESITKIGNVLNANLKAKSIIAGMKSKVEIVKEKVKSAKKPSVYYVVGYGKTGDYTATKDTFIGDMIEMAGGVNAANDATGWKYSIEKLVQKNPDILICRSAKGDKEGIENTIGYKDLTAVKTGKLLEIDNNLL
ncbi:MAG: ABC transporter substrate-binding protein, partial [Clostridiaceae bacterium]|nr:ABC transporter substrate-binding protein [Clostridiaceae bacterium]